MVKVTRKAAAGVTSGRLVGRQEDLREQFPSSARTWLSVLGLAGSPPAATAKVSNLKSSDHLLDDQSFLMEAAGVEPASASGSYRASTCIASLSVSPGAASEQPAPKLAT